MTELPEAGPKEWEFVRHALVLHQYLDRQLLAEDVELLVPRDFLVGGVTVYGLPIRHADVDSVYLAHRLDKWVTGND